MQTYRNRLRIISDVLNAVLTYSGEGGASLSALMRRSNLSYRGVEQLISQLVAAGMLTERKEEKGVRYVVSAKGCEYLAHYTQFKTFAESYGLRL
jgi:predicted transcriptional regulator